MTSNYNSEKNKKKSPLIGKKKEYEQVEDDNDYAINFSELYIIAFPNFLDGYDKFVEQAVREDFNEEKHLY